MDFYDLLLIWILATIVVIILSWFLKTPERRKGGMYGAIIGTTYGCLRGVILFLMTGGFIIWTIV